MARTFSTMLPLGTAAPDFDLPDVISGDRLSLASFSSKPGLLVIFICAHCPFVVHLQAAIAQLGRDYPQLGILAISSNSTETHPQDGPDGMRTQAEAQGFTFPYAYDESQAVAKAYTAACTPDFFLFDRDFKLAYRGQFDDSRPGNDLPVTGADLRAAIDAVLAGAAVPAEQKPSIGCNIKWHPGQEPDYYGAQLVPKN